MSIVTEGGPTLRDPCITSDATLQADARLIRDGGPPNGIEKVTAVKSDGREHGGRAWCIAAKLIDGGGADGVLARPDHRAE